MTRICAALLALAGLLAVQPALAVRPGEVSYTAEAVCVFRAIGAQHPDPKLRNGDHLAMKLCQGLAQVPRDYEAARRFIDNSGDTYLTYFYVNARTHYIDEALVRAAAEGATQVVVLGAGFDSRAYRFRATHPALRFFEVDLPATIEAKRRRVAAVLGAPPDNVRYAPIDFNTQRLEDVLPPLGYDPRQRSLFLLEGVVMYVVDAGNAATFSFIRRHAAPGSTVVFDYVLKPVIQGKYAKHRAAGTTSIGVAMRGEPYISGWTPREAAAFARKHGLKVVEDVGPNELTSRHLTGSDGKPDGVVIDWHRIITAQLR